MRSCPICGSGDRASVYRGLVECVACAMVYESNPRPPDYGHHKDYGKPLALGSGETEEEKARHRETARIITGQLGGGLGILDIGCARGGLLEELRDRGHQVCGVDPLWESIRAVRAKGIHAELGSLPFPLGYWPLRDKECDLAVLSHVVEHLVDPVRDLRSLRGSAPRLYVEVPDSCTYDRESEYPFYYIHHEHVNHFTMNTLVRLGERAGCALHACGRRAFSFSGHVSRCLWAIFETETIMAAGRIEEYVNRCRAASQEMSKRLAERAGPGTPIAIWGAGHFTGIMLREFPAMRNRRIVAVVDGDPGLQGSMVEDEMGRRRIMVQAPEVLRGLAVDVPILVGSVLQADSIRESIGGMGLRNPVVMVTEKGTETAAGPPDIS